MIYWTEVEDVLLRTLWTEGKSAGEIAKRMPQRNRNMIMGRLDRLGCLNNGVPRQNRSPLEIGARLAAKRKPFKPSLLSSNTLAPLNLDILALGPSQCRWATTNEAPHLFCGHPQIPGSRYCEGHTKAACSGAQPKRVTAPFEHTVRRVERMAA